MLAGDDLTIALFLLGTALTLAAAAMSAAGWRHPILISGLFLLAFVFSIAGIGWPFFKTLSPPTTAIVDQIATHPVAWFVVLILGIVASLLYRIGDRPLTRTLTVPPPEPENRQWFTSLSIGGLCDKKLIEVADTDAANFKRLETEDNDLGKEMAFLRAKIGEFADILADSANNPSPTEDEKKFQAARKRSMELFGLLEMAREKRTASFNAAISDLYYKLRTGRLVAKGFLAPIDTKSEEIVIPASRWRFLKFNGDFTEATGEGITYKAIAVARV